MDRRTLFAVALCFLIFFGWQKYFIEPKMHKPVSQQIEVQTQANTQVNSTGSVTDNAKKPSANTAKLEATSAKTESTKPDSKQITVGPGSITISNSNRVFESWTLHDYRKGTKSDSAAIDMQSVTESEGQGELNFDLPEYAYLSKVRGTLSQTPDGILWSYEDGNVKLTRKFTTVPGKPYLDMTVNAEFKGKKPGYAFLSLASQSPDKDPEANDRQLLYWTNKSIERMTATKAGELEAPKGVATPIKWAGVANRYFVMSIISEGGAEPMGLIQSMGGHTGRINMVYPISGNSMSIPTRVYFGPKELDLLRVTEPSLDNTVDFGWFTIIAYPLLKIMKALYGVFHNYGIAIILLTLLVKILTYPLTYKSMKSMKEMAKLQPQLAKIREKHKDDKEALNREMLSLMKTHGYNPMAGCLPLLIQMPIFFALYRVLYGSIELYHAPFALWIMDLSAKDPFYVTPVLLSVLMFIQQKMTPNTATDPMQAKMMQFMPLIFGVFMLTLPSGLTLYMLVNALASIVQQFILNKKLDTGRVPALAARANK